MMFDFIKIKNLYLWKKWNKLESGRSYLFDKGLISRIYETLNIQ